MEGETAEARCETDGGRDYTNRIFFTRGFQIVKVQAESPASRAGLKAGDSIMSINGQDTLSVAYADVIATIQSIKMQIFTQRMDWGL